MTLRTEYEWVVEFEDRHGDIQDVHWHGSYDDAVHTASYLPPWEEGGDISVALVRYDWASDGTVEREYAYVRRRPGGHPPELCSEFGDGTPVPMDYVREVERSPSGWGCEKVRVA